MSARQLKPTTTLLLGVLSVLPFACHTSPSTDVLRATQYIYSHSSHWPIHPVRIKLNFPRIGVLPMEILCTPMGVSRKPPLIDHYLLRVLSGGFPCLSACFMWRKPATAIAKRLLTLETGWFRF